MGTNFYWKKLLSKEEGEHIGKRSSAGLFCWDCGITLCKDGIPGIHRGKSAWHDVCPKCGNVFDKGKHPIAHSASVELGFSKPREAKPSGVHSCSSFTWAINPFDVRHIILTYPLRRVIDEYGRSMSGKRFLKMVLNNCPIVNFDLIGEEFS